MRAVIPALQPSRRRTLCLAAALWPWLPVAHAASEATAWPAGQPTPELALADSQGKEWSLAAARGKVVIVNFWASWCEPCRAEMPSLQSLADLYGSEVLVLAVNFKERDAKVAQFARTNAIALPTPMDRDGAVAARWGVKVFPSSFVVGRDGRVRWRVIGEVDWTGRDATAWLAPLLK